MTTCEVCKDEEIPTGDSNFYMEHSRMCLHCYIVYCDCGLFYGEELDPDSFQDACLEWKQYVSIWRKEAVGG